MKVESGNPPRSDLERLKRQKQNLVEAELSEIDNLKNFYKSKKEIARGDHEVELEKVKDAQRRELLEAVDHQQGRLSEKLEEYKRYDAELERSRQDLVEKQKQELQNIREEHRSGLQAQHKAAVEKADELSSQTDGIIKKAKLDSARALADGQRFYGESLEKQARTQETNLKDKENMFRLQSNAADVEHAKTLNSVRQAFQRDLMSEELKGRNRVEGQRSLYQSQLEKEVAQHDAFLLQQRQNFEQRFNSLKEAHEQVINNTQSRLVDEYLNVTSGLSNSKEAIQEKSRDPFYRPTLLRPKVEDGPGHYLVHLDVPEHEREHVTLSANQRQLKVNYTRNYEQLVNDQDGSKNKSKRSEIFSREFSVPEILDPRSVSQKYENGRLTFKINKA